MFMISDNVLVSYLNANEKFGIADFINQKTFRVASTPLSYRQVNSMDSDNLLPKDEDRKQGWRKFSIKEVVYFLIVQELKKFGFKHIQLKKLWSSFFRERDLKDDFTAINKYDGEIAIGCVLCQTEITLRISSNGEVIFLDPVNYNLFPFNSEPYITIGLNSIVNKFLKEIGFGDYPTRFSNSSFEENKSVTTSKEKEILDIIRDENYSSIRLTKKDGEVSIIHAEKSKTDKKDVGSQDILKLIKDGKYQNVTITQMDGKIVNCKVEDTFKL